MMLLIWRERKFGALLIWVLGASTADCLAAPQPAVTTSLNFSTPNVTSSIPAPSTTFTPNFNSHDRAEKCWESWYSYSLAYWSIRDQGYSYTTLGTFPTYVETVCCYPSIDSVHMNTLCDGFPRGIGFPATVYNITSTTTHYNYTLVTQTGPPLTKVTPTCSIDDDADACTRLWSSRDATYTSLKSASALGYEQYGYDANPPCFSPLKACPTATECSVEATSVTMYYWPVTTASGGDFCAHNGSILTPTPTDDSGCPNTVESGDMTFTSPSVYIVAPSAFAWYATRRRGYTTWGQSCGIADPSFTYAVDPDSISTINPHTPETLYPMDWQDLNTVRHEAYQRACPRRYGCSWFPSIVSDFTPYVKMPSEVRTAKDEWEGCSGKGIYNPQLVRLGEGDLGGNDGHIVVNEAKVKPSAPASNKNAKSTRKLAIHGPESTHTGYYPRKEFIEELRVIVLDEIAPADAEEL